MEVKAVLGDADHSAAAGRTADQVEYVAPEYFWDNIASAAGDVYAVALLVYAGCNAGRLPFQPENPTEKDRSDALRRRMKGESVPRPQSVSDPLWSVLEKALSYDAESRYLTARELLTALGDTDEALPSLAGAVGAAAAVETVKEAVQAEETATEEFAPEEEAVIEEPASEEEVSTEEPKLVEETATEEPEITEEAAIEEAEPVEEDIQSDSIPEETNLNEEIAPEGEMDWTKDLDDLSHETALWEEEMEAAAAGLPMQEELAQSQEERAAANVKRQYTVQKDFENTRRSKREPSMAPAAQR